MPWMPSIRQRRTWTTAGIVCIAKRVRGARHRRVKARPARNARRAKGAKATLARVRPARNARPVKSAKANAKTAPIAAQMIPKEGLWHIQIQALRALL